MNSATSRVAGILLEAGSEAGHLPPTALYNEGWLLRLVLDWFARQPPSDHPLSFLPGARWYSEALLGSPFRPRHRGDRLAESWTHADGVVGHFFVRQGRGDIALETEARQFTVVEAKLFSPLSAGTKNAEGYNQAARNVACMAHLLSSVPSAPLERSHFVVAAPSEQIRGGVFCDFCTRASIEGLVARRVAAYDGEKDAWFREVFDTAAKRVDPVLLAWEDTLEHIEGVDVDAGSSLREFYARCLRFNRPAVRDTRPGSVASLTPE
jgi:hypothetical protein